jgi:hypothetical protein
MHMSWPNFFYRFQHNEHKEIAWAKAHATCKWDQLQIKLALKPTLVRLVSFMLIVLLSIPTWGVWGPCPQCDDQAKKGQWSCLFNSN